MSYLQLLPLDLHKIIGTYTTNDIEFNYEMPTRHGEKIKLIFKSGGLVNIVYIGTQLHPISIEHFIKQISDFYMKDPNDSDPCVHLGPRVIITYLREKKSFKITCFHYSYRDSNDITDIADIIIPDSNKPKIIDLLNSIIKIELNRQN